MRVGEKIPSILDADDQAAVDRLLQLGFLLSFKGAVCLKCGIGRYGVRPDGLGMFRCTGKGACRKRISLWHGSAWQGSTFGARRCYNLAVGYAAGLTPTMASIDKGVNRKTASANWSHFRKAEAASGRHLQDKLVFAGAAEAPAEVEVDECAVKKVPVCRCVCVCASGTRLSFVSIQVEEIPKCELKHIEWGTNTYCFVVQETS